MKTIYKRKKTRAQLDWKHIWMFSLTCNLLRGYKIDWKMVYLQLDIHAMDFITQYKCEMGFHKCDTGFYRCETGFHKCETDFHIYVKCECDNRSTPFQMPLTPIPFFRTTQWYIQIRCFVHLAHSLISWDASCPFSVPKYRQNSFYHSWKSSK